MWILYIPQPTAADELIIMMNPEPHHLRLHQPFEHVSTTLALTQAVCGNAGMRCVLAVHTLFQHGVPWYMHGSLLS